ncbi:MAG: ATP-binding protein [Dietzia sp.]
MATESRWELSATTDERTLDRILDLVGEMSAAEDVDEDTRMRFEVAVAEIAANVIEHAGDGGPVGLRFELTATPQRLEARFSDDGTPARVNLRGVEMPDVFADRGRGLAIALAALDELDYRRKHGNNMWHLVCYRGDEGGGDVADGESLRGDDPEV